jgi:hypothetical protein
MFHIRDYQQPTRPILMFTIHAIPTRYENKNLKSQIRQCLKADNDMKHDIHYNNVFPTGNTQINVMTKKCLTLCLTQAK